MRTAAIVVGLGVYVAMGVFPYLASTLLAPLAGVVALMTLWVAGLVATGLLARRRSLWVLAAPPLALAVWFAVITAGERLLGWTA